MVTPYFHQSDDHLQVPDPSNPFNRRGSDPGPSASYHGTGNGTWPAAAAGGSSFFPGNATFDFTPPDPLHDITSHYTSTSTLFPSSAPALQLDNLSHDLKFFEAQIQENWFHYSIDQLLQLQTLLLGISRKVGGTVERLNNLDIDSLIQSQPSTAAKSSHTPRFNCKLCPPGERKDYSSRTTFTRHVADRHYAQIQHRCPIPGCSSSFYRPDYIRRHCKKHASETPGLDLTQLLETVERQVIPPPRRCHLCSRPVRSWKEWMNCTAFHCRILENTRTDSIDKWNGRRDDDDFDDNDNGNGHRGHLNGNVVGNTSQDHEPYKRMGSQFDDVGGAPLYGGYYNGFAVQRCSHAGADHNHNTYPEKSTPKYDETPETESATEVPDDDTPLGLSESPRGQHKHCSHAPGQPPEPLSSKTRLDHHYADALAAQQQFSSSRHLGNHNQSQGHLYNDALNPRPVPRTRLSRAMQKCCFPVSPPSDITTPKPQSKMLPADNSKALMQKKSTSRKLPISVCDARSPKLIHLAPEAPHAERKRRCPTKRSILFSFNQPLRAFARWQTALKTDGCRGCLV